MPKLYAVAYARVSKGDQARKELSIPAQLRRIREYAEKNGIEIVAEGADEAFSAFKDNEKRDEFWRLVDVACQDRRVSLFLVDDMTRFFRDRYLNVETKSELRRHGVRVLPVSNPYDTSTITGVWQEAIDEARAQTESMAVAYNTIRGMEENIRRRDPVTGWCYKNGGRAPFGYRAVHVVRGQDDRGRDIRKTLWEIDEEAARVLRWMYERRAEGAAIKEIHRELNALGMRGPTPGKPWTISSVIELMRDDRVLQAAGVGWWNKEDHRTPGRRFKDRSEWIRVDNAHPAIISMELAQAVIARRGADRRGQGPRAASSPWLLSGKNALGEDMFVCLACGARMAAHKPARRSKPKYLCGSVHYRGRGACIYKPIDKTWIEGYLLEQIRERFGMPELAEAVAREINEAREDDETVERELREDLERALKAVEGKIANLVRAVAAGFDPEAAKLELEPLKAEKARIEKALAELEATKKESPPPVEAEEILKIFEKLQEAFEQQDVEAKRRFLRAFVRRLEFDPETDTLRIYLFAAPSPVCTFIGARDGDWCIMQTVSLKFS